MLPVAKKWHLIFPKILKFNYIGDNLETGKSAISTLLKEYESVDSEAANGQKVLIILCKVNFLFMVSGVINYILLH